MLLGLQIIKLSQNQAEDLVIFIMTAVLSYIWAKTCFDVVTTWTTAFSQSHLGWCALNETESHYTCVFTGRSSKEKSCMCLFNSSASFPHKNLHKLHCKFWKSLSKIRHFHPLQKAERTEFKINDCFTINLFIRLEFQDVSMVDFILHVPSDQLQILIYWIFIT